MTTKTDEAIDRAGLAAEIRSIAIEAGKLIMTYYERDIDVRSKDDRSPVTDADEAAEDLILDRLRTLTPDIPVIAEELAAAGKLPDVGRRFWLVDPLDGTKEFLNRNGEFTVNIALVENGSPTVGVVYAPAKSRLFYAAGPGKAFEESVDPHAPAPGKNGQDTRPIAVRHAPADAIVAIASRSHRDKLTDEYLSHYDIAELKAAGSSLKFCLVAAGEADLYPRHGPTMEWDTAAGDAVLRAAGGAVIELDGSPLRYGKDGFRNPHFIAHGAGEPKRKR